MVAPRVLSLLLSASVAMLPAAAQQDDPLAAFIAESALSEAERVDPLRTYLLGRIPEFNPADSVADWESYTRTLRRNLLDNVVLREVPVAWREHEVQVAWTDTIETDHGYRIRKLRYEALPGFWIPALLYEPNEVDGRVPAILNVNGHVGAPGKASDYEQIRCINLAKRGMLAMHPEWLACGELVSADYAHHRLAYLDLVGVSGLSVFYYALERALDVLLDDPRADPERVAMTGLSGGGWQTTVFSALDERVRLMAPNAGHSGFALRVNALRNMGDLEQAPVDLLTFADYSHLTALFAPRPALLIYNAEDNCCFTAHEALPTVFDPVLPVYKLYGRESDFTYHVNEDPGTHNYERDNRLQFYAFIERYFLPPNERMADEFSSDDELLSFEELEVGLPKDNATFKSLALDIAGTKEKYKYENESEALGVLRMIAGYDPILAGNETVAVSNLDGFTVTAMRFESPMGPFPVLMVDTDSASDTAAVLVTDDPIEDHLAEIRVLAERHGRAVVIQPLLLGQNEWGGSSAWQYGMALQSVGHRLLGIQAAQMNAVCDWLHRHERRVRIVQTEGPRSGTAALIFAALTDVPLDRLDVREGLDSFLQPIEEEFDWAQNQSLFCFGLQAAFEIEYLHRMISRKGIALNP